MNTAPIVENKQQADKNAISGKSEWTKVEFADATKRAGTVAAKGVTRERATLNRNKLVSRVGQEFRAHFAGIYLKTDKLPSEVFAQIELAVDEFIAEQLGKVNKLNAITYRRAFYHRPDEMEITERVTVTGENRLTIQEQKFGVTVFLENANRKLTELQKKPTPDYEMEKRVKEQILRLEVTQKFILAEIQHQEKLASETVK